MAICGIDFSTRAVDVVLLDEDTDAATWHRFELAGQDAFDRTRNVRRAFRSSDGFGWFPLWENVLAVGIEEPRGYNAGSLYRVQGAILASIPSALLVQPWIPSAWRKTVGLPGNASKGHVGVFANGKRLQQATYTVDGGRRRYPDTHAAWPQDACDAYCIALATRTVLEQVAA